MSPSLLALLVLLGTGSQPDLGTLFDGMVTSARPDLEGRALVRVESTVHPEAERFLSERGENAAEAVAFVGARLEQLEGEWTFAGQRFRLERNGSDSLFLFDGGVGVLFSPGLAVARTTLQEADRPLGLVPWQVINPWAFLTEEELTQIRSRVVDEGDSEEGGRRLRKIRYTDPWQPFTHQLWVDPTAGYIVMRQETALVGGGLTLRRVVEGTAELTPGRFLPTRVVEELSWVESENQLFRFPLVRRVLTLEARLEKVPPERFRLELPLGTTVINEILGSTYAWEAPELPEAELKTLALGPPTHGEATTSDSRGSALRCGVYALFGAAQLLGRPASLATVEAASGFSFVGVNLDGLSQGAQALGLWSKGVRTTLAGLESLKAMGIAAVDGRHFLLVVSIGPEGVDVLDAPAPRRLWSRSEFESRFSGAFLLLARPGGPPPPP